MIEPKAPDYKFFFKHDIVSNETEEIEPEDLTSWFKKCNKAKLLPVHRK